MIELHKNYRTRGGQPVRLLMVDGGGDKPIIGAVYYRQNEVLLGDARWVARQWHPGGTYSTRGSKYIHAQDLLEIPFEQADEEPPTEPGDEA